MRWLPALLLAGTAAAAPCPWQVELLDHQEPDGGPWTMAASVRDPATGAQATDVPAQAFRVLVDGKAVASDKLQVERAREALGGQVGDPVQHDLFVVLDLSASMATVGARDRSRLSHTVETIVGLLEGDAALFERRDRVHLLGFDGTGVVPFLEAPTADRAALRAGLQRVLEFEPKGEPVAQSAGLLAAVEAAAADAGRYASTDPRRDVLVLLATDGWNGFDPDSGKALACDDLPAATAATARRLDAARAALGPALHLQIWGLDTRKGARGGGRKCRIDALQEAGLDDEGLQALVAGGGEVVLGADPTALADALRAAWAPRRQGWRLSYPAPAARRARQYTLELRFRDAVCAVEDVLPTEVLPTSQRQDAPRTSTAELAVLLASCMVVLLFLPRALVHLGRLLGLR